MPGTQGSGCFYSEGTGRGFIFFTWKAKNQWILSINAVSPQTAKRRIWAALWRSPVLSILQTENLKRKASRFDWRILYNICTSLLPTCPPQPWQRRKGAASRAAQADLFTSDRRECLHKQGVMTIEWRAAIAAWRCEVEPDGSVKWSLPSSPLRATPWQVRLRYFFSFGKKAKKNGGRSQNRTGDTGIFSPLLYRLS